MRVSPFVGKGGSGIRPGRRLLDGRGTEERPRPVRLVSMGVVGSRGGQMAVGEQTRSAPAAAREPVDEQLREIPYAVRWLVPKGERFANFPLLNDNDTQLDYYRRFGHVYAVGIPTKK